MRPRLLVTGTRDGWGDEHALEYILYDHYRQIGDVWGNSPIVLVHGGAQGVDTQAERIWMSHGLPVERHMADWKNHGKGAGPRRNALMVSLGADQCIGFLHPDSRGTRDCLTRARAAKIPITEYLEPWPT